MVVVYTVYMKKPDDSDTASLFVNGGSQAVRLPRAYRFEGSAVKIRREGRAVILEPLEKKDWPEGYWERIEALGPLPPDFDVPAPLPKTGHRDAALRVLSNLDEE